MNSLISVVVVNFSFFEEKMICWICFMHPTTFCLNPYWNFLICTIYKFLMIKLTFVNDIYITHVSFIMKRNSEKKIKKRWEDMEELHVSYCDSLESNFHVSKVSLPGCLNFQISFGR